MTRVFVYGSLRRGEPNHALHLARARFLGEARTKAEFTMFDLGSFPAIVTGGNTAIVGEVYDVDDAMLAALDRLESHPRFYTRTPIVLADDAEVETYVLASGNRAGRSIVESGDWCRRPRKDGRTDADRDA